MLKKNQPKKQPSFRIYLVYKMPRIIQFFTQKLKPYNILNHSISNEKINYIDYLQGIQFYFC